MHASSKHLSQIQKDAIRAYVIEAENETVRKQRKQELMHEYQITEGVINALIAWVKIRGNQDRLEVENTLKVVPTIVAKTLASPMIHETPTDFFDACDPKDAEELDASSNPKIPK